MSANKVYVLAHTMAQALHYRRHLKESDPEIEIVRIVESKQLRGLKVTELHLLDDWQKTFKDENELAEYCRTKKVNLIYVDVQEG